MIKFQLNTWDWVAIGFTGGLAFAELLHLLGDFIIK